MKLIVFCLIVATTYAAPQNYPYNPGYYQGNQPYQSRPFVPILSEQNEINPDGSYHYSYTTGDGQQAQASGYLKNAGNPQLEAEVAQGSYSYTAPDGTPISVTWIADEYGFRAEGAHLPTPPPIPEAIQRSLALVGKANPQQYSQPFNKQYGRFF